MMMGMSPVAGGGGGLRQDFGQKAQEWKQAGRPMNWILPGMGGNAGGGGGFRMTPVNLPRSKAVSPFGSARREDPTPMPDPGGPAQPMMMGGRPGPPANLAMAFQNALGGMRMPEMGAPAPVSPAWASLANILGF